jgi:hypothetical protein
MGRWELRVRKSEAVTGGSNRCTNREWAKVNDSDPMFSGINFCRVVIPAAHTGPESGGLNPETRFAAAGVIGAEVGWGPVTNRGSRQRLGS